MQCANCQSLFFKTLETRVLPDAALLLKKRCKRCKFKYLFRKEPVSGTMTPITYAEWVLGRKVNLPGSKVAERPRIFVSEYTRRISATPETQWEYLEKIQQAERTGHEHSQKAIR